MVVAGYTAGYRLSRSTLEKEFQKYTLGDPAKFAYVLELIVGSLRLIANDTKVPDDGNYPDPVITLQD